MTFQVVESPVDPRPRKSDSPDRTGSGGRLTYCAGERKGVSGLPDCILISVALQRKMKVALRSTGSGEGKTDRGQYPGAEQDRSMSSPKTIVWFAA